MYCKYCGQALQPGTQFCPRCGRPQSGPTGSSGGGWSTSSEWFQGWEPLLYIACLFFPIFAIVIWAMYHQSPNPKTRNFVRNCIISALAAVALFLIVPVCIQMASGVALLGLLHGVPHSSGGFP